MTLLFPSLLALFASLAMSPAWAEDAFPRSVTEPATRAEAAAETRPANCLQDTGSRIKRRDGSCLPLAGRTHRADDLRATGAPTTGNALRDVDPSLRVFPGY